MPGHIEYSFADYIATRKGEAAARLREGAAYAYGGDLKVRSTLARLRPVTLAMDSAIRFWQTVGRNRLLSNAVKVSERQFPQLHALLSRCVEALQIPRPALFVSPAIVTLQAHTFGTSEEASIVLGGPLMDHLTEAELTSVIGHECGHIQNNHTVYLTARYFLQNAGNLVVRWAAQPATLALRGWVRRAEITCDRASLLCTRDLDVTTAALVKLALGSQKLYGKVDVDEYLRQLAEQAQPGGAPGGPGRLEELLAEHPYLPRRIAALRLFSDTTFYKSVIGGPAGAQSPGITKEECDARVAELLGVL